jgi:outer membrane protein insertion porin family/translocation and assembly module TamA
MNAENRGAQFCWWLLGALMLVGCGRGPYWPQKPYPPEGDVVSDVEVGPVKAEGADHDALLEGLSTARSPRFLGIWDGVAFEYEVFDDNVLARDLERVERYYRARGYYEAKVTAARVIRVDEHHVRVEIRVEEGEPVRLAAVPTITGTARFPLDQNGKPTLAAEVMKAVTLRQGDLFDEARFQEVQQAIGDTLADRGYAFVRVKSDAQVDIARHTATVRYDVEPGPHAVYGKITIQGLAQIPEGKVRQQLYLRQGKRYSRKDLKEAQDTLVALGVFSRVDVHEDLSHPESGEVPLEVSVTESALRTVRIGGGVSFDVLRFATRLRAGWEHRNFLGGMRRFAIDERPGITYYPLRIGLFVAPTRLLPENRLHLGFEQPSFIEGRTSGFLSADYNLYPLLYYLPKGIDPSTERIIGYHEFKTAAGVQRTFRRLHLTVRPSLNWQADFPFTYQGQVPDGLDQVHVVFPELVTALDFRDDPIQPHTGLLLTNTLQVAGLGGLGSVEDVRVEPEARAFLPMSKQVTLALRTTVGLLFPRNYGQSLSNPAPADPASPAFIRDQHRLLFRVFYSGGPNSNRGYPFRWVGPHGPLGFLVLPTQSCAFNPSDLANVPLSCLRPLGGLSLWEGSLEVRFPIWGALGGVAFFDASNVARRQAMLDFMSPHLSPGLGARYMTPVGPLRVDVGYRLVRTLVKDDPSTPDEDERAVALANEPDPGNIFGVPIAINVSLFEAF